MQERVYDVAVSDGRQIGADGRAKTPVGSTVNIENATFTNTIGDAVMAAHWVDPIFPRRACVLLRARAGDPDAALDDA